MPALPKQDCQRPKRPQGDTMYRAAAVAAALMVLATLGVL